MSIHNFKDGFNMGFLHGMFGYNPFMGGCMNPFAFGGFSGFGDFGCFNSCFSPMAMMYAVPNTMYTQSFVPLFSNTNFPTPESMTFNPPSFSFDNSLQNQRFNSMTSNPFEMPTFNNSTNTNYSNMFDIFTKTTTNTEVTNKVSKETSVSTNNKVAQEEVKKENKEEVKKKRAYKRFETTNTNTESKTNTTAKKVAEEKAIQEKPEKIESKTATNNANHATNAIKKSSKTRTIKKKSKAKTQKKKGNVDFEFSTLPSTGKAKLLNKSVNDKYFDKMFNHIFYSEGGYVNDKDDRGGPTKYGVIQETYNSYRRSKKLPTRSVQNITIKEVKEIYYNHYKDSLADRIDNPQVAFLVFDIAINSGPGKAKELFRASGGDVNKLIKLRGEHYKNQAKKPHQAKFLKGWNNRWENAIIFARNNLPNKALV